MLNVTRMQNCDWAHLTSLRIYGPQGCCSSGFLQFLKRHATSLRSLSLKNCYVTAAQLAQLRSIGLQLTSLEITCDEHSMLGTVRDTTGQALAYVNSTEGEASDYWPSEGLFSKRNDMYQIVTKGNIKHNFGEGDIWPGNNEYRPKREKEEKNLITYRDGRTAIGEEPLEYFTDWNSEDEGHHVVSLDPSDCSSSDSESDRPEFPTWEPPERLARHE